MSYVAIHKNAFEAEMNDMGFSPIKVHGTAELVYERKVPNTIYSVRVLSSIDPRSGISREVGADAIRVTLWNYSNDRPIKVERRVNRTGTERGVLKRTRERAREVWSWCKNHGCSCGNGIMVERNGKNGKFLGCSNYPTCTNTAQIQE